MVVEKLTFIVDPAQRAEWLEVEERTWSRFLERQDGFVRKEMWVEEGEEGRIHAVIWWESMAQWKAIGADTVSEVDASMGDWYREPALRTFHVVRDC